MAKEPTILTIENFIKFTTLILTVSGLYFKLTSDIRDIITTAQKDKEFMEYRVSKLEDCCNDKGSKQIVYSQPSAIMPHETKMERD